MKFIVIFVVSVFGFTSKQTVKSEKILAIFPTPSKSHWLLAQPLMQELAKSGHHITVISAFPLKNPPTNYRDISITEILGDFQQDRLLLLKSVTWNPLLKMNKAFARGVQFGNFTLNHRNVQTLLKSNETFDLIFLEIFLNEAMLGFGHHFNAPIVGMSTVGSTRWIADMLGTPLPLSYIPSIYLDLTNKMSFADRMYNLFGVTTEYLLRKFFVLKIQEELYEKNFLDPKPSFDYTLKHSLSIGLINNHFSFTFPQPMLANSIDVSGMHINSNPDPLSDDMKKFIESSEHGVIYFSMGSNFAPSTIPKEKLNQIYNALIKQKQKVIWKWDAPESFNKHKNILIDKWFPQDSILCHSNVVLFITHGGLLSFSEAVYFGVPLLGIPIFGDQYMNMARVVANGLGLRLYYQNISEESLDWALSEILTNKKYKNNAVQAAIRYRDRPQTPLETAKYWVEYAIRNKGASHMRSSSQDLSFIEYHMIDVWLTISGFLLFMTVSICIIVKIITLKIKQYAINTIRKKNE